MVSPLISLVLLNVSITHQVADKIHQTIEVMVTYIYIYTYI